MKRVSLLLFLLAISALSAAAQLVITTTTVPNVTQGQTYPIVPLQATGAIGGAVWSVISGNLPPGFVVGQGPVGQPGSGVFCFGTPSVVGVPNCTPGLAVQSVVGTYTFTIQAQDKQGQVGVQQYTMIVASSIQITTTSPLPNGIANVPYGLTLNASGGVGPYIWILTSGTLPAGMTLDQPTGILYSPTGSPAGTYNFTVQVSDLSTFATASQAFTLFITFGPLQLSQTPLPPAIQGSPYSASVSASGGLPPYRWSLGNGNTQGLGIDPITGAITGTPPSAGNFQLLVFVQDATGTVLFQNFALQVTSKLVITTNSLPSGEVGLAYSQTLVASGGVAPYGNWTIISGALPPNVTLSAATGVISGSPTASGLFSFTAKVSDSGGQVATLPLAIGVAAHISISTSSLANSFVGGNYSQLLTSSGGFGATSWVVSNGALPAGINLNSSNGILGGTPTVLGSKTFTITVTDALQGTAQATFTITINTTLTITSGTSFAATQGVAFSQALTASGGQSPLTWTILAGAPPPGLNLTAAGVIQGTPTATGSVFFSVRVTDPTGQATGVGIAINVFAPLTITTPSLSPGLTGSFYAQGMTATGGLFPYNWTIASGNLPVGIGLAAATGFLSGTSTPIGTSLFTVQVTDAGGRTATAPFSIQIVAPVTIITDVLPSAILGQAYSQPIAVSGGAAPITWTVQTGVLPAGIFLNASTGVLTGTPTVLGAQTFTIQATDSLRQNSFATYTLTAASTPALTIGLSSATQPAVSLTLASPYPLNLNGTIALSFASSVGGTDNMIRFAPSGSTTLSFLIPAGTTAATFPTAPNASVIQGTVAGTITLTLNLLNDSNGTNLLPTSQVIKTIVVNTAAPVISSVTMQQVSGGINVIVTGYSNTREFSTGLFHFTVSSGNTLTQADITVQLAAAATTWYSSATSNATGGQFKLTMPFTVSQGTGTAVTAVQATITNTKGPSNTATSQ